MKPSTFQRVIGCALAAWVLAANADAPVATDPANAEATVPPVVVPSAFGGHKRIADTPVVPWRAANDRAARIGGWRAYAREAQAPEAPASAPAAHGAQPHKH
jgi:hypothetical protein